MNIMNPFEHSKALLAVAIALLIGVGCATAPPELEKARATYDEVAEGPTAQLAPAELKEAEEALQRAEQAFDESGDSEVTRALAYAAERRAMTAKVHADTYQATQAKQENEKMLLAESEKARRSLQSELAQRNREVEEREERLERERQRLEEAQSALEESKERGDLTEAELKEKQRKLEEQQEKLASKEKQLAVTKTELEQAKKEKEEMAERLKKAREKLDEFANVSEEKDRMIITLNGEVLFQLDESDLRPAARRRLDQVVEVLIAKRDQQVTVKGHTDSQGKASYNMDLSQRRADSVKDYLVSQGIADDRIKSVGRGETEPVASNETSEGRANNRRVEIIIEPPTRQPGTAQN